MWGGSLLVIWSGDFAGHVGDFPRRDRRANG